MSFVMRYELKTKNMSTPYMPAVTILGSSDVDTASGSPYLMYEAGVNGNVWQMKTATYEKNLRESNWPRCQRWVPWVTVDLL